MTPGEPDLSKIKYQACPRKTPVPHISPREKGRRSETRSHGGPKALSARNLTERTTIDRREEELLYYAVHVHNAYHVVTNGFLLPQETPIPRRGSFPMLSPMRRPKNPVTMRVPGQCSRDGATYTSSCFEYTSNSAGQGAIYLWRDPEAAVRVYLAANPGKTPINHIALIGKFQVQTFIMY